MQNKFYVERTEQWLLDNALFGGVNYTQQCNEDGDLQIGYVMASSIKFTTSYDDLQIGDKIYYYYQAPSQYMFYSAGEFYVTEIERQKSKYTITALDAISKLDMNVDVESDTLANIVDDVCTQCGIEFWNTSTLVNGSYVADIPANIAFTGRQIIQYVAELNGSFVLMDPAGGVLQFKTYPNSGTSVNNTKYVSYEYSYEPTPYIGLVRFAQDKEDVGIYSGSLQYGEQLDVYNNQLINFNNLSATQIAVDNVCTILQGTGDYYPATIELLEDYGIFCGARISVYYEGANSHSFLVMKKEMSQSGVKLYCYGRPHRDTTSVPLTNQVTQLKGKYNKLSSTVDGLEIEIGSKVGEDEVVTKINASAEAVTINTNKLNLTGYITATDVGSTGTTIIDGGRVSTGVIQDANGKYSLNMSTGEVNMASANITGGSINIATDSSTFDIIQLSHEDDKTTMSPALVTAQNLEDLRRTHMTPNGFIIYKIDSTGQATSALARLLEEGLYIKASGSNYGLSATGEAVTLKNTSGTTLTQLNQNGLVCHCYSGSSSTVSFAANNTWYKGSELTLPKGYYAMKARAVVAEATAYCRFAVGIHKGSALQTSCELGSSSTTVQNQTFAFQGTTIECTQFVYVPSSSTFYASALSKGAGGGTGGSANVTLTAMRIG